MLSVRRDRILHEAWRIRWDRLTHALAFLIQLRCVHLSRTIRWRMIMHHSLLSIPVIVIFPFVDCDAEFVAVTHVPTLLVPFLLHPAETLGC